MTIRPAVDRDVPEIAAIILHHAADGVMLPRSEPAIASSLGDYVVAEHEGRVVACGGLQRYSPELVEICGLATEPGFSGKGSGSAVVQALVDHARRAEVRRVFALTLVPGFFERLGFRITTPESLPAKIWRDCIACPKFGACNEIAVILDLHSN